MFSQLLLVLLASSLVASAEPTSYSNLLPLHRKPRHATTTNLSKRDGISPQPLTATEYGIIFDVEVTIGNQLFNLLVDTGSSDTWVVNMGFECINATDNAVLPQADCNYAKTYTTSPTFEQIPNQNFGVQYGVGIATGIVGFEDVSLGGLTVTGQEIGLVNSATNVGDGFDSGVIGFGYPILTSAHPGNATDNTTLLFNRLPYDTFFINLYKRGLLPPGAGFFSLALARLPANTSTGPGGFLGLGVLPSNAPPPSAFSIAPVEITATVPLSFTNGTNQITEWTLTVDTVTFGSTTTTTTTATNSTPFQAVVDSGNFFNVLPAAVAAAVNAAFVPPATLDPTTGLYAVACNATAPPLGFTLGTPATRQTFWLDPADLILPSADGSSSGGGGCMSSVIAVVDTDGVVLHFLGDPFLKNVVAVFDMVNNEMRFAPVLGGGGGSGGDWNGTYGGFNSTGGFGGGGGGGGGGAVPFTGGAGSMRRPGWSATTSTGPFGLWGSISLWLLVWYWM